MSFYWSKSLGMTLYGCTFKSMLCILTYISIRNCHQRKCNSVLQKKNDASKHRILKSISLSVGSSLSLCLCLSLLLLLSLSLFCFRDEVFLCSPGWLRTCCVSQVCLRLVGYPVSVIAMLSLFCSFFFFRQSLINHYRSCPGALIMPLSPKCPPVILPLSDQFLDVLAHGITLKGPWFLFVLWILFFSLS